MKETLYIGVDGEGQGRISHKYVFLAASTADGVFSWSIESPNWESTWDPLTRSYKDADIEGLSTQACLDFLLALPKHAKCFAYAFNYDATKILSDLENESLYFLFRPDRRPAKGKSSGPGAVPYVVWKGRRRHTYHLNLQGTKFTIQKNNRRRIVWDIFKFYQGKFVSACEAWRVGTKEERKVMSGMKDKRGEFDRESPSDVREYCLEECRFMAQLALKLVDAHDAVDLPLKSFYGAGSSASAMLLAMGIKEKLGPVSPKMLQGVACAFFGGRFENSVVGAFRQKVFNFDISSAYPYQLCFLPCLLHGTWERTKDRRRLEKCKTALVHYRLRKTDSKLNWGPYPFRTEEGSICFPIESGGGWVWLDEYLVGERLWPNVEFLEAWVYSYDCECQPFLQIPNYYLERIRLGKEGPGIVLKLGMNSCYGKVAQSIGNALFNSWAWAGMITSGCRAQLLELFGLHSDWNNILMLATDGLGTLEDISAKLPLPRDTGTALGIDEKGKEVRKPLGGWEKKESEKGLFLARPGIYFPMNPTEEELSAVRARGVGRGVVYKHWEMIVNKWEEQGMGGTIRVNDVARFCGAKTSISQSGKPGHYVYNRSNGANGPDSPKYGNWIVRHVDMGFDPLPKRERLMADGKTLEVRRMAQDRTSVPYQNILDKEGELIKLAAQEAIEQPDAELQDYESEMGLELV